MAVASLKIMPRLPRHAWAVAFQAPGDYRLHTFQDGRRRLHLGFMRH